MVVERFTYLTLSLSNLAKVKVRRCCCYLQTATKGGRVKCNAKDYNLEHEQSQAISGSLHFLANEVILF